MSLYLKNAIFINWKTFEFSQTNILVDEYVNGKVNLLPSDIPIPAGSKIIDCSGKYVTKAFANGHHHVYSVLGRGMPPPKKTPENFLEILKNIWWKLDKNLNQEMIRISALITAMDCAKNGVTFVIDHHSSPGAISMSLETIAKAFDDVGISHLLCYEISDRDGKEKAEQGLEETENYLQKRQGLVGLHASFTVGNSTFRKAVGLTEKYNTGIHLHIAEDKYDQEFCNENYNKNVIERIKILGGLNSSKTILAHCLHLNDTERNAIGSSGAWVVQNAESNMNNQVGFFNSVGLGENIMLGTDGMHSDMLRSAKAAYFTGLNFDKIDLACIYKRFRNTQQYIIQNGFSGDAENNLVVLDYQPPTAFDGSNFLGHFIYGLESKHIQHVISNGKIIVQDRKIANLDEEIIVKTSIELSRKLWDKMK
jgi:cytosine/adenosine deaminase-related metal-dependent hydrolase